MKVSEVNERRWGEGGKEVRERGEGKGEMGPM